MHQKFGHSLMNYHLISNTPDAPFPRQLDLRNRKGPEFLSGKALSTRQYSSKFLKVFSVATTTTIFFTCLATFWFVLGTLTKFYNLILVNYL